MKQRLREFIRKSKTPDSSMWSTEPITTGKEMGQGRGEGMGGQAPGKQAAPSREPGSPSREALDGVMSGIDMPEDLSTPLQGNPAMPQRPGEGSAGNSFKERLRRRRLKDYSPVTGI